jgi:hypothetical protein
MAATTKNPSRTATTRSRTATTAKGSRSGAAARGGRAVAGPASELSEDVVRELEKGADSALDAVRKFLVAVDEALPPRGEGPSRREEVADSALEMAQRLVHTQAQFLRHVVESARKSVGAAGK